jgi:hypothetical protein
MSMSKQIGAATHPSAGRAPRQIVRALALLLCVSAILFESFLSGSAQRATQSPIASATARNAALVAATQEVLTETSEIRELSIMRPVQSGTLSRAEIESMLVKNFDEDTTPAQSHATEVTLKKFGLVPVDFQFRPFIIRLLTEQVAGYYDPKTQQFHIADWIDLNGQKAVMAHELTHALQDQHFNLHRFEHWPKGDSDAELAAHALIEGDASLAMMLYVAKDPARVIALMKSLSGPATASEEIDKAPRVLRETLLFPYEEGLIWTKNLYKQGGWSLVSKAFTELPQSTEQILHTEKYLAHEAPVKITLPDISPLLNAGERVQRGEARNQTVAIHQRSVRRDSSPITHYSSPNAWRRVDYDVNGEWTLSLILDSFLKSRAESNRAAAGWGGDRYEVFEGPNGGVLLAMLSAWDTEADALEFFDAYAKRTQIRYPAATLLPASESRRTFQTSEGVVVIELRGARVLVVEGIPKLGEAPAVLQALWR